MKRILPWSLLLLTLLLILAACDVVQVDVDTTIIEDGSGDFTIVVDSLTNAEGGCDYDEEDDQIPVLVNTPAGPRCRLTLTVPFEDLVELGTYYDEYEEVLDISCLEMVDGNFYFDGELILEDDEPTEDDVGTLNIRFILPGQISSSNAPYVGGNTVVWSIDVAAPPERLPMSINMNTGDLCPSEAAAAEGENGEAGQAPQEAVEEEASEEEEIGLNPLESALPADLDGTIHARMGCSVLTVEDYTCQRLIAATDSAKAVTDDVRKQIPDASTIAAQKALYNIEEISMIAFSRDENGELIFPSLNASMPIIIQMAWNGMEFPQQAQAMVRYATMLADYDNQRYAADHGE